MFAPKLPKRRWQCNRCFEPLKNHQTLREAHRLVCEEINDVTCSAAEEEGDDLFIDASVSSEEEGAEEEGDDVFIDASVSGEEEGADEEGDDLFIDASVSGEEEGVTTVEQPHLHAWMETLAEMETLCPDHIMKYMDWGPKPLSKKEEYCAEFLSTVTSGVGMSKAKIEKLLRLWNKRNGEDSLPLKEETCWKVIEDAHARMAAPLERRSVTVPIPEAVQALLFERMESLTWEFWNPCEVLIRLMTMGPLSAIPSAFALFPIESDSLDDFCHGEKMKRIFEALPRHTSALSSILYFDELYLDEKGHVSGEGAIVVGAFFNKAARNSTYAKACFGTFPSFPIPQVFFL